MDPVKAAFLQAIMTQGKDVTRDNFLPFLMAMQKNAADRGISFTNQEADFIYEQMKDRLSDADRKQMELLRMLLNQTSASTGSSQK